MTVQSKHDALDAEALDAIEVEVPLDAEAKAAVEAHEVERFAYRDSEIVVTFQHKPRRMYTVNGIEVPSVTTVLEVLAKPSLPWWGMFIGVEGMIDLTRRGEVRVAEVDGHFELVVAVDGAWEIATRETVVDSWDPGENPRWPEGRKGLLTQYKLTTNHVKKEAAARGTNVHDALERWALTGTRPDINDFPPAQQGYVKGLLAFISDIGEAFEPKAFEVTVGSAEHGFAGRYDLEGLLTAPISVATKVYPKKATKRITIPAGLWLWDLKTSKDVYDSHVLQLEAYEGARVECGLEPTYGRGVLQVSMKGEYQFVPSNVSLADYVAVLGAYHAQKRAEEAIRR